MARIDEECGICDEIDHTPRVKQNGLCFPLCVFCVSGVLSLVHELFAVPFLSFSAG